MGFVRTGVHRPLEDAADELLRQSMAGVTSMEAKSDILTPWKQRDRLAREVYVASGVPDSAIRQGMYHRVANPQAPHLNSRDGVAIRTRRTDSLTSFVESHPATEH